MTVDDLEDVEKCLIEIKRRSEVRLSVLSNQQSSSLCQEFQSGRYYQTVVETTPYDP